jgi:hypothetical protein
MNKIVFLVFLALILISCEKNVKEPDSSISMDIIILNILHKLGIDESQVERKQLSQAIHYTIPVNDFKEIDDTDYEIKKSAHQNGVVFRGVISSSPNRLRTSFWSPQDQQYIVIEIFQKETTRFAKKIEPQSFPMLCIIIDDFGQYKGSLLDEFCELPPEVAFAVLPGLPFTQIVIDKAIKSGREVIVHIPMEANSTTNPGRNAIFSHMSDREIYARMDSYFTENNFAIGANNHMGSKITSNRNLMRAIFRYLAERDFHFIDSRTTPNSVARQVAIEMGVAYEVRDLFLDTPTSSDAVLYERLRDLKRIKESKNRALVITHCFDRGRLQRLKIFIEEAQKMGFVLVPPSQYVIK